MLNLDAEDELASPSYREPPAAMRARIDALVPSLRALLAPGDVVLGVDALDGAYTGRAWCPTPSALARMRRAGVAVPRAPDVDVLRRANDRAFSAALGQTLPGATFATSASACERALDAAPGTWLLKRAFGFAGRGRRKVVAGALVDDDRRWIAASLRTGGLQVEPLVAIQRDFAIHGVIDEGRVTFGAATVQRCDAHGAWLATELAAPGDLDDDERAALDREARAVADALVALGYFGPFGVDAYRWRDAHGARFNARSEINARHTMGYAVGMAAVARASASR